MASDEPSSSPPPAARAARSPGLFELCVIATMALGAVVFVEPAPFDLLMIALMPAALVLRKLAIPTASSFALVCVAAFLLANLASLDAADDLEVALRFLAITVYLIVAWSFVLGFVGKQGVDAIEWMFAGWVIGAVATTVASIASYFGFLPFAATLAPQGRMHGLFKDANVLGAYLVAPALWSASRLVALERGRRLRWAFALVVLGVGVVLTYSRGAWISLAMALLVFFFLRLVAFGSPRSRAMLLLMVPVAALLLALALDRLASVSVVQDMLDQRLGMQRYDNDRFATQREALELATRSPWGIGPGQSERTFTRAAHNAYVRAFVENGYLGGLALSALMIGSFLRATWLAIDAAHIRTQMAMAVIAGAMAAICVESLVIDSVHWRHMWVLAALAWAPGLRRGRGPPSNPHSSNPHSNNP